MRSLVGFSEVVYRDPTANYLVLVLDRELSRRETSILVSAVITQSDAERVSYPADSALGNRAQELAPRAEPFHLDWVPKITAPPYTWFPFDLGSNPTVPDGFDLDRYNAIGFYLPEVVTDPETGASAAFARDWSVLVLKHPPIDAQSVTVLNVIPNEPS